MKKIMISIVLLSSGWLIAPPDDDFNANASDTKKQASVRYHEPQKQYAGRSEFEQALKMQDFDKASQIFDHVRKSPLTTEQFAVHLKDLYSRTSKLVDIYPDKTSDEAGDAMMNDLYAISPHLAKVLRDSFNIKSKNVNQLDLSDDDRIKKLRKNPYHITNPDGFHEKTPLEIAVDKQKKDLAGRILKLAKNHGVEIVDLVDPLINNYKNILQKDGYAKAHAYLKTIYNLENEEISKAVYDHIKDI
jgi:hypothetical protein